MNFIKYLRIDSIISKRIVILKKFLSEIIIIIVECDCNYSFNDVEERLEGEDVGRHFRICWYHLLRQSLKLNNISCGEVLPPFDHERGYYISKVGIDFSLGGDFPTVYKIFIWGDILLGG